MRRAFIRAHLLAVGLTVAATSAAAVVVTAGPAEAATCADVEVVFARGTGEAAGLGSVGRPFASSLASNLSGRTVTSYAVNYAASGDQRSAGPGATDMSNHIASVAASCANTRFVIGGYSQGATVTDIAVGIRAGLTTGTPIPSALANRVAAVVVFGNPLGTSGRTIATASTVYGPKSRDYCNAGDPVCGAGSSFNAHLQYVSNGSASAGARFAASLVGAGTPTPPPTNPTPPPTNPPPTNPPPTPTPTPPAATCVRASTADHVRAGRAVAVFGRAYARGTRDYLGRESTAVVVSLTSVGTGTWALTSRC